MSHSSDRVVTGDMMTPTIKKVRKFLHEEGYAIGSVGVAMMREVKEMSDQQAIEFMETLK